MDVVSELLKQGADIDKAADGGYTPLIIASKNGHGEVVSVLLDQGADIDKPKNDGEEPFEGQRHGC